MKVTVTKNLNVRVGKPSVNAPCYQYIAPGSILEVDGNLYKGDSFDGIDTWMKDEAGNYYWSGGVLEVKQIGIYPWWLENSLFSIPKLWTIESKNVVKVAILDTGLSQHYDLDFSKISGYDYVSDTNIKFIDNYNHGTHLAGIIAAQGKKIMGIAPETHLFIAKVCDDKGRPIIKAVKNALDDIYAGRKGTSDVKVINMSFDVATQSEEERNLKKDIESLINKLVGEKQNIIVGSIGGIDDVVDSFPARMDSCIAVGSVNSDLFRSKFSRITKNLDIMAPGEKIASLYKVDSIREDKGTSQAAAFITGVCSLAFQKTNSGLISSDIFIKVLYQTAFSNAYPIQEYGHGVINPNKLIETLNTL